ncbi:hypothetical protein [Seonamhaeicola maritimus]|uniref:hypothetical protein n=1 Tax=Seonamhaeicola maritimus TaxID=2591822 RepID=UPI0024944FB0|nr:hypothetical protein [Seonamhaeicola maritimus]
MKSKKATNIIKWIAWIYGGLVLLIPLIALYRTINGGDNFITDWRKIVLYTGLIIGLSMAYKLELIGGFIHPLLFPPGILYIVYWFLKRNN